MTTSHSFSKFWVLEDEEDMNPAVEPNEGEADSNKRYRLFSTFYMQHALHNL